MIFKTMKNIAFSLGILISGLSYGQELLPSMYDSTLFDNQINIEGNAFELSTSLYNDFGRKFIFGGEISRELSEETLKKQKEFNRVGGGVRLAVEYRSSHTVFNSQPNWSWRVS